MKFSPKGDSWDIRWLRGRKVSAVLATSKLASKVRSKIKAKKSYGNKQLGTVQTNIAPYEHDTNIEVGSVDHYKELTRESD